MRIQRALLGCNSLGVYRRLWPVAARFWRRLGVKPTLIYVDDKTRPPPSDRHGQVHVVDAVPGIPTASQASMCRYWACTLHPDDVLIPCDIDLLPLSRDYFIDRLADIDEHRYVHIDIRDRKSPDKNPKGVREFWTACYHIARGDTMRRILRIPEDWKTFMREANALYLEKLSVSHELQRQMAINADYEHYYTDETFLAQRLNAHANKSEFHLLHDNPLPKRKDQCGKSIPFRISRWDWNYSSKLLREGYYVDAHCPRSSHLLSALLSHLVLSALERGKSPPRSYQLYRAFREKLTLIRAASKLKHSKQR